MTPSQSPLLWCHYSTKNVMRKPRSTDLDQFIPSLEGIQLLQLRHRPHRTRNVALKAPAARLRITLASLPCHLYLTLECLHDFLSVSSSFSSLALSFSIGMVQCPLQTQSHLQVFSRSRALPKPDPAFYESVQMTQTWDSHLDPSFDRNLSMWSLLHPCTNVTCFNLLFEKLSFPMFIICQSS